MKTGLISDLSLQYILSVPSAASEHAYLPLVIVMHGRGADASDLSELAPVLDGPGGYRFVFPNGPQAWDTGTGMTIGYKWFDNWPPEGNSLRESRSRVLPFINELVRRYPTPKGKIIISGFSQGALMALDAGYRTAEEIAGIVSLSGGLDEKDLPDFASRRALPVLIVHGTNDAVVSVSHSRNTRLILESHGINPDYYELSTGHYLTPESIAIVVHFIRRHLC
jgi:phospholipase/carboxylesterase